MSETVVGIPVTIAAILCIYHLCRETGRPAGPSWFDLSMPTRPREKRKPWFTDHSRTSHPSKKAAGRAQQTAAHRRRNTRR